MLSNRKVYELIITTVDALWQPQPNIRFSSLLALKMIEREMKYFLSRFANGFGQFLQG